MGDAEQRTAIEIPAVNPVKQSFNENLNSIKLPPFSINNPKMWFVQVESIFDRNREETECLKAQIIMSKVDTDSLSCVRHIVMPGHKPDDVYSQIKNGMIANFEVPHETHRFQLIRGHVLSSGKPSQASPAPISSFIE